MSKNTVTIDLNSFMIDGITEEVAIHIGDGGYWITFGSEATGYSTNMEVSKMDLTMLKDYLQRMGL
jgi:hypothetical protein